MSIVSAAKALLLSFLVLFAVTEPASGFRNVKEGQPAPGFTMKDTAGKDVSLSDSAGKVVVVIFVRADQNSEKALADLQKISDKYAQKGVTVMGILSETNQLNQMTEVIAKEKITFPVLIDEGRQTYGAWGTFLYPSTGVLDKQGMLLKHVSSWSRNYLDDVEGNVRLALGEISKEHLEEILNPKDKEKMSPELKKAERHMLAGQRMVERKLFDKAADEYAQAVEADPNFAEAKVRYGFLLLKTGDVPKATELFKKAVELEPKNEDAAAGLGASMVAAGEVDKGIEMIEASLKTNTKPARAHFELGKAYEKKGAFDKAALHYKKAVEDLSGGAW